MVVITDVYAAGEEPIAGVSGRLVARRRVASATRTLDVAYVDGRRDLADLPARDARPGDVVLTLGAGDLTTMPDSGSRREAHVVTLAAAIEALAAALPGQVDARRVRARALHDLPVRRSASRRSCASTHEDDFAAGRRRDRGDRRPGARRRSGLEPPRRRHGFRRDRDLSLGGWHGRPLDVDAGTVASWRAARSRCRCSPVGSAAAGVAGLEFFVGIPGSVGGAVRMNAGGHGRDTSDVLVDARVGSLDDGASASSPSTDLELGYRRSAIGPVRRRPGRDVRRHADDPARCAARIDEIVRWRREHQPGGQNAGSVFTNPPGDAAGRLIEASGCKGLRIGGARVSEKHANFFVADPGAAAADVHALVREVQRRRRGRHRHPPRTRAPPRRVPARRSRR